jgi:trehalose 6-phosphate synthase
LQHGLWDLAGEPRLDEAWESYRRVNEGIAGAVIEELATDTDRPVWFHDYHLYVAPPLVRAEYPEARLAHFVHIPLARPRRVGGASGTDFSGDPRRAAGQRRGRLPHRRWRGELPGLGGGSALAPDVDVETGVVEHAGWSTLVTAHPISVDTAEFDELARRDDVLARRASSSGSAASE